MSLLMHADEGDDDYKFASVGQGSRFGMNRARRNVSFEHGGVFDMRENSWDFRHHDDSSVTGTPKAIPVIGSPLVELLCGSASIGQSTLTRFYSLHTFVLPLFTAVFMLMHFPMICNQGISGPL